MDKKILKTIRIDAENYKNIEELISKDIGYNFSSIVNAAIYNFFNSNYDIKKNIIKLDDNSKFKSVRVNLSEREYKYFDMLSFYNGFGSVKQIIKFILLNYMADKNKKIFNNIEMLELVNTTNDLNKLGRNINEIVKLLKTKKSYEFNMNFDKLADVFKEINDKILEINNLITEYKKVLNLKVING